MFEQLMLRFASPCCVPMLLGVLRSPGYAEFKQYSRLVVRSPRAPFVLHQQDPNPQRTARCERWLIGVVRDPPSVAANQFATIIVVIGSIHRVVIGLYLAQRRVPLPRASVNSLRLAIEVVVPYDARSLPW